MSSPSEPRRQLHVLTRADVMVEEVLRVQRQAPATRVATFDLRRPEPDYGALLEAVLEADQIIVW